MDKTRETIEAVAKKHFRFRTANFLRLARCMSDADQVLFPVDTSDIHAQQYRHYVRQNTLWVTKFTLQEGPEMADMEQARVKWLKR